MSGGGGLDVLVRLHGLIEAEEGPLAEALAHPPDAFSECDVFAGPVAQGARTSARSDDYALLIESIFEGYLLHYANGRILESPDQDLRLIAGDFLYAFGLARLAQIGDLEAVAELAELISLCAQAHAVEADCGGHGAPWRLTAGLWALSVLAVAHGRWSEQEQARSAARAQAPHVAEHLISTALARAQAVGGGVQLERALIAFEDAVEGCSST